MEMSYCRVSSCINSMTLGKAILFRASTETEKKLTILVSLVFLASKLKESGWKISVIQYWNKGEGHKHVDQ